MSCKQNFPAYNPGSLGPGALRTAFATYNPWGSFVFGAEYAVYMVAKARKWLSKPRSPKCETGPREAVQTLTGPPFPPIRPPLPVSSVFKRSGNGSRQENASEREAGAYFVPTGRNEV